MYIDVNMIKYVCIIYNVTYHILHTVLYPGLRSYHFIFQGAKTCLTQATATPEVLDVFWCQAP